MPLLPPSANPTPNRALFDAASAHDHAAVEQLLAAHEFPAMAVGSVLAGVAQSLDHRHPDSSDFHRCLALLAAHCQPAAVHAAVVGIKTVSGGLAWDALENLAPYVGVVQWDAAIAACAGRGQPADRLPKTWNLREQHRAAEVGASLAAALPAAPAARAQPRV